MSAWKGPSKEFNDICDTLNTHRLIASGMAKPHQETNMTSNAVADGAEAGQVDEKPLLKNGGQRIVEIGSLCESPQFLDNLGSFRCEAEKIGKNPEPLLYSTLKV